MDGDSSLFEKMGGTYDVFCRQQAEGKMEHVRKYSRKRLDSAVRKVFSVSKESLRMEESNRNKARARKKRKVKPQ